MTEDQHIILVENDNSIAESISRLLAVHGFTVSVCTDPVRAMEVIEANSFDLVLTDLEMPRLSGLSLLQWIKKKHPQIRVFIMSEIWNGSLKAMVIKEGAEGIFDKPILDFPLMIKALGNS